MQRTIYITRVRDPSGAEYDIIGKVDIKTLTRKGINIIEQRSELRFMSEETYYQNSFIKR